MSRPPEPPSPPNEPPPPPEPTPANQPPADRPAATEPTPRSRYRTRQWLLISGLSLVALLIIGAFVAWYWVRSGRVNRYVADQIVTALREYGIRAEVGGFELGRGLRTATLRNLKLYNQTNGQLIATVDRATVTIEVREPFAFRLSREVAIQQLDVSGLQAYAAFDAQGRSNFDGVHQPPPRAPSRITVDTSALVVSLGQSAVHYQDAAQKIAADLTQLKAQAQPVAGTNPPAVRLTLNSTEGHVTIEGREARLNGLEVAGRVDQANAQIEALKLSSEIANATASGRVENFQDPRYSLQTDAHIFLDEARRLFAPDVKLAGEAGFKGEVTGEGANYRVTGRLSSNELIVTGVRVRGVDLQDVKVEPKNDNLYFGSRVVHADSVAGSGFNASNVAVTAVNGNLKDGRAEITADHATAARATGGGGAVNSVALGNVKVDLGREMTVRGDLSLAGGSFGKASIGQTRGQLTATPSEVALNKFTSSLLGGSAAGNLTFNTRGGTSRLQTDFKGLQTSQVFAVTGGEPPPLAGTVTGRADINWPGAKVERMSGIINADFAGQTTATPNAIPVTGQIAARATNGVLNFDQFSVRTDATTLDATGSLALVGTGGGNSNLNFTLASTRAEELMTIASSIPAAQGALSSFEPHLAGDFRFQGTLSGPLTEPTIAGDVTAASVGAHDHPLGSLSGHLVYSPQEVRFEHGQLTATNGGTLKVNYAAPLGPTATTGKLDATLDRISAEDLVAAAGIPLQQKFLTGEISGAAHLTGLPAAPQGTVNVSLVNGQLLGQPASATNLVVNFDQRTARVEKFEAKLPQGTLSASGNLDLQTKVFQVQGRADQIDLARLGEAFELDTVALTGTADATFQATGNADDLDQLKLELNAQGKQVTVNGRDAGELRLTARTSAGGRIDAELVTGIIGKPQAITASIELKQPGRPITLDSTLTNFDLAPLLAIFAPGTANSVAGTVSGRLHVAGPLFDERGDVAIDRLRGNLTLTDVGLNVAGNRINVETPVMLTLANNELRIERTRFYGQNSGLNLGGVLGLGGDAGFNFSLNGNFNLDALNAFNPDYIFGGTATADVRLTGTFAAPRLGGEIRINDLALSSLSLPVAIDGGTGRIVFAGDRVVIENFTANANDGTLRANGEVALAGLQPSKWQINVTGEDVNIYYLGARIVANTTLQLNGTPNSQTLSGRVNVPIAEYTSNFSFDSLGGSGGLSFGGGYSGGGGSSFMPPINLDIRVEAPDSFLIRNEQVNTVASASLTVGGTISDPDVSGRVTLEGGSIKFRGQRYDITTGTMSLPGGFGMSPQVNLVAEGDIRSYHVYVGLVGPINDVQVTLRAEPDLSRQEILALITTGSTEGGTLNSESIVRSGVGTAASFLTEEFVSQPLGKEAEKFFGLNRFQIDPVLQPNANPAARLTIGRPIARNLSFTYSTNLASEQDQILIVEYNLTNKFSALASYTQGGSSTQQGSNRDNKFTIEVRGRKRFALGTDRDLLANAPGAGSTAAGVPAPARPPKREFPKAAVDVDKPDTIKLSKDRLRELLPVIREGYSRALTRLGERNLTNYLQEQGYFFAEVKSRCEPATCSGPALRVLYDVNPGEQYSLREIRITGTEELNKREVTGSLQSQTGGLLGGVPFLERLPFIGGTARGITSNDRLRNDRENIRRRMMDLGFRSARVASRLAITPESNDLALIFDVEEGPRSVIADVALKGNAVMTTDDLRKVVPIAPEAPFSPTDISTGAQQIRNLYANQGFLDVKVEPSVEDLADNRVRLTYTISEGARAIVKDTVIAGNVITKESSIRRFFYFKEGDVLTPKMIERTQRDLHATGAFREVNVRNELVPGADPSARHVTVGVTEAKPLLLVYGLGYSTDEGVRLLGQLTDTNLFGRVNSGSLKLRGSRLEQLAQLSFTDFRPFGSAWATTFSTFYNRNSNLQTFVRRQVAGGGTAPGTAGRTFGINRFAAFVQSERKFGDFTSIRLRYSFENAKLFNLQNITNIEATRNEQATRLGVVAVGVSRDTRDSVLSATRGQLVSGDYSLATRIFGGNESFQKFFGNYQRYYTLPDKTPVLGNTTFAFSARVGLSKLFRITDRNKDGLIAEAERRLPISERFFSGGATTLRGFRFEQAGPQGVLEPRSCAQQMQIDPKAQCVTELPTLVPLGGDALVALNLEMRYPLTQRLRLVPFYDGGNVFRSIGDVFGNPCRNDPSLSAQDRNNLCARWTNTVGMGLRFNTPLGPVGFDYGVQIKPPTFITERGEQLRQPRTVFHIRFGQTF